MGKPNQRSITLLFLVLLATSGWSSTLTGKSESTSVNAASAAKPPVSVVNQPDLPAIVDAKESSGNSPITDAPDPATPFLVGTGLIIVSLLRRRLQSENSED